jgi:hypothetical protein
MRATEVVSERTIFAMGGAAAVGLADGYGEGVKLVEEAGVAGRGVGGEGLAGEIGEGFVAFGAGRERKKPVALGDAAEILVGDGDGVVEGVEENGVGSLGTDTRESEKAAAENWGGSGRESFKRTGELLVEHGDKCLESRGLAGGKAGGLDKGAQVFEG